MTSGCYTELWCHSFRESRRPHAGTKRGHSQGSFRPQWAFAGHMAQKTPYWRASCPLGHPKQRKFKFDWMKSLCFG